MMAGKTQVTSSALQYAYKRSIGENPEQIAAFEEEFANAEPARKIDTLRTDASLSQRQLAKLVGTTASVICRLEDADDQGHSLAMLRRIAPALNKRVEIRFIPAKRKLKPAGSLRSSRHEAPLGGGSEGAQKGYSSTGHPTPTVIK
jgi:transcriptional regulator with XRE-family HTH domain